MNSWKKIWISLFVSFLCSTANPAPVSAEVEPLTLLNDCSTTKNLTCIKDIYVISEDGMKVKGELTGRERDWTQEYAPESVLRGEIQEYKFPRLSFAGLNDGLITPLATLFPIGNRDCFYTPCVEGKEYLQVSTFPSLLAVPVATPIHYGSGISDLRCGTKQVPSICYTQNNFNKNLKFEYHIQMPSSWSSTAVTGRGMKEFAFSEQALTGTLGGTNYKEYVITASNALYSSFGIAGADIDQDFPAYEIDSPDFVLWGRNSNLVRSFGKCQTIQGVSAVSNAFWVDLPTWNQNDQELQVVVHGAHFKSDGTLNKVYFHAEITSALAKCLWGIDLSKSTSAKLSITYDGNASSEVQTLVSHYENGVFALTASGLHLSTPRLGIKLSDNPAAISEAAEPNGSEIKKPSANIVKCRKGNLIKKISGVNPKCPKGFRRVL